MGSGHHATSLQEPPGMNTSPSPPPLGPASTTEGCGHKVTPAFSIWLPPRQSWGEVDPCLSSDEYPGGTTQLSVLLAETNVSVLNTLSFIRGPPMIKKKKMTASLVWLFPCTRLQSELQFTCSNSFTLKQPCEVDRAGVNVPI